MTPLFTRLAAAYVRGAIGATASPDPALFDPPLDNLSDEQLTALLDLGRMHELRLHRFKRTMGLPRVQAVLGILRGIGPTELLDIGSGRGAFLWPLLDAFPWLPVTAIDTLDHRVAMLRQVAAGGVSNLHVQPADATDLPFAARSFDVVTMLEVLEHIPDTAAALRSVLRTTRRFVVLSVPSRPDDNPEHIHLFRADHLTALLHESGATRVNIDHVPGHMVVVARVDNPAP